MTLYTRLYDGLIAQTDPEKAHAISVKAIAMAGQCPLTRRLLRATLGYSSPRQFDAARQREGRSMLPSIGGRPVRGRLGLAAGMDKNACAVLGMSALGFGFLEVGTVTPRAQPGNPSPRLWRLMATRGIRNHMGFNNGGAEEVAMRLRALRATRDGRAVVLGVNIGKNKTTSAADAPKDYYTAARLLSPYADFIVVNVSSPNTPGLRDLQAIAQLRSILNAARRGCDEAVTQHRVPLFVKISPDLSDEDIVDVVALTQELGVEGVVATNTTITHDLGEGGVSGPDLFPRALNVVRLVGEYLNDDQTLIATGGITSVHDARRMLDAGADLVEAYTGFVYEGPSWPGRINRALQRY